MNDQEPALLNQDYPVKHNKVEMMYTTKINNYTMFNEVFVQKSTVNIISDLTGFMSSFFEKDYTIYQLKRGIEN